MSFPNIIYGHYGQEKETTSSKKRRLGTKMVLPDGRTFFYGSAGEAITAGKIAMGKATLAGHIIGLAIAAAVPANTSGIGALTVTNATTAVSGSEYYTGSRGDVGTYEDGYIYVNDEAGEGQVFPIWRHSAAGSSGTITIDLFENDFVATALTTSSDVGLAKSIYDAAELWDVNDIDGVVAGVPARDLASGYYGWFQTAGPAAVLTTGTVVVGKNVMTGETDGAMVVIADDSSTEFLIGGVMNVAGAAAYSLVDLQIRY
tara:strand:+ start:452 stop:1228 length:777 start_codon:yes stop_codon:yes gene_type:complete